MQTIATRKPPKSIAVDGLPLPDCLKRLGVTGLALTQADRKDPVLGPFGARLHAFTNGQTPATECNLAGPCGADCGRWKEPQ